MPTNKNKLFIQIASGAFLSIVFTLLGYLFIAFFISHRVPEFVIAFYILPLITCITIITGSVIGVITGKHNFQKPKKVIAIFSIGSLLILSGLLFLWWWA